MKVVLVNPPWVYKRLYTHGIYPAYGLLMIATILEEHGHDVELLDANALDIELDEVCERLSRSQWDVLGLTTFTDTFTFAEALGGWRAKHFPDRPLVLGGPLVSSAPEVVLEAAQADIACLDEAFHSAPALFAALQSGSDLADIPGLLYRNGDGGLHRTGKAAQWEPLDDLPLPNWELLDVQLYLEGGPPSYQVKQRLPRYLSTITTLGCPYKCTFCQVPVMFDGVRSRSPQSMVAELHSYKERYAVESMYFRDDILFRPEKIGRAFAEADLGLIWSCLLRADMMKPRTLKAMKEGGCAQIRVGLESGDDVVLERSQKQTDAADNARCLHDAREAGIDVSGFLIVGLPGESERSLAGTLKFVRDNDVRASVHFPLPLPGTPLFFDALKQGLVADTADLLRRFSEPQLPGQVLQPPAVNFTDLPPAELVRWASEIAEAARGLSTGFDQAA